MLTDLRRDIKKAIEDILRRPSGEKRISVWINEDSAATEGSSSWYDESMRQVRQADIVVVLFSGDAGTLLRGRNIGICHAELQAALSDAPTKIRRIDVRELNRDDQQAKGPVHDRFVDAFEDLAAVDAQPQIPDQALKDAVDAVSSATQNWPSAGSPGRAGARSHWVRPSTGGGSRSPSGRQPPGAHEAAAGEVGRPRRGVRSSLPHKSRPR